MVDIGTHRIVDVLESREVDDVAEWLKTYPNLDTVSRDGSVSYNSAIKKANANIGIPSSGSHYEGEQADVYWEKPSEADIPTRRHHANCEKKVKLVEQVRELTRQGNKRTEISAELGISPATVKRYQSPDFNPVNACYNTTRGLTAYHNKIHMLRAVYEGIVFSHMTHVKKLLCNRKSPESIRLSGGAANSDVWVQIFADALQIPVDVIEDKETGVQGAVIAAGVAVGVYSNYKEAVEKTVIITKTVQPRREYKDIYEEKYNTYRKVIESLGDTWQCFK